MSEPIVLGIESTCDETAAAVVQGRTLISNVVASSMDEHARYGGVIPEIASRAHAEAFVPCVSKALADANMTLSDVDAIGAAPARAGYRTALGARLGVPVEAISVADDERMHTAALAAAFGQRAERLPAGARVLFVAAGADVVAGAALYRQPPLG